jgi:hypothetical protein
MCDLYAYCNEGSIVVVDPRGWDLPSLRWAHPLSNSLDSSTLSGGITALEHDNDTLAS